MDDSKASRQGYTQSMKGFVSHPGYIAFDAKALESTVIASRWPKITTGAGSVKSSAGT